LFVAFSVCAIGLLVLFFSWLLFKLQRLSKWVRVRNDEKRRHY
jgi:hypothetical protein